MELPISVAGWVGVVREPGADEPPLQEESELAPQAREKILGFQSLK